MIVRSFLLFFSVLLLLFGKQTYASTGSEQIHASVSSYMLAYRQDLLKQYGSSVRIEYEINNLDPRLSMANCLEPLTVKLKSRTSIGRANVKVSCLKGSPWSIYVPVEIKLYRHVVVTRSPLSRQTMFTDSTLYLREMDVSKLRGSYFTSLDDVLGMQSKRQIPADTTVVASHIETPIMIKKGESVLITAKRGSLVVKNTGTAMMDGRIGQQISVRNRQSRRVIDAKVVAPGQVLVLM